MSFLTMLLAPHAAAATNTARVVLVASSFEELARKVRAEAEHTGMQIAVERSRVTPDDAELVRRHQAVGIIELESPDRVRIYVAPSGEHSAYQTTVERAQADGDGFPLRVVEQIRGRLVELALLPADAGPVTPEAAEQKQPEANPPPAAGASKATGNAETPRIAPASAPTLGLAVGGSAVLASGGLGVTPGLSLGLRVEPTPAWAVTLHGLLPIAENDIFEPEGEGSIRVNVFFAEASYRLLDPTSPVRPELGAGAGFAMLSMEAETIAPHLAHTDQLVAGIYFLQAGVGWAPNAWFRLRGTMRGGFSAPRPVIVFSDREVATWGRALGAATLEAEFHLPLSSAEARP